MRAAFAVALLLTLAPAAPGGATTIVRAEPHDPRRAEETIRKLIVRIEDRDFEGLRRQWLPRFYTDRLGEVEGDAELRAFLEEMNSSNGKPDQGRYAIYRIHRIVKDEHNPTYTVHMTRGRWQLERSDANDETVPPGYESVSSTWFVTFRSNEIQHFRQANELFRLGIHGVKGG